MPILHWFRKDLRLEDNTALSAAHADGAGAVIPVYISEPDILARPDMAATRVRFVLDSLTDLSARIEERSGRLTIRHGEAGAELLKLARESGADAVYFNAEYEPDLIARDEQVARALESAGVRVRSFHDRLLVAPGAVMTAAGEPFSVFTPFRRACEKQPVPAPIPAAPRLVDAGLAGRRPATLEALGFATDQPRWPAGAAAARRALGEFQERALAGYATDRDRLDRPGTSQLSPHLRFGALSPRQVHAAVAGGPVRDVESFVSELRWRDFYAHVMFHFPHVVERAFRPRYDDIRWVDDPESIEAWRRGRTGYPVVDAAMRQLVATGWMHNRARMIVASFLTKDLLAHWAHGERWFMNNLVDGDPASNNGGWQWAAGTGTDAQPWFRIFNPVLQGKKFDPDGAYVRRWVPELSRLPAGAIHAPWEVPPLELAAAGVRLGDDYPEPICDHAQRRGMALALYGAVR